MWVKNLSLSALRKKLVKGRKQYTQTTSETETGLEIQGHREDKQTLSQKSSQNPGEEDKGNSSPRDSVKDAKVYWQ